MKVLYLDCYSGISGDMFLGALVDAGLGLTALQGGLSKLSVAGYRLQTKKVSRSGINSTKLDVIVAQKAQKKGRCLKEILSIIDNSKLDRDIKDRSAAVFRGLARAEARIHGRGIKGLHLHEVGDLDSIVDVVGAAIALKLMKIDRVYSSEVNVGGGAVIETRGGALPIPAPAALYLLKGLPIVHSGVNAELVTPTGAALLRHIVDEFCTFPDMVLRAVGYGGGARSLKGRPNCLRVMIGEVKEVYDQDSILTIEANIDDMNPVDYEHLARRLFEEGALDVYLVPVQMKKMRPGIVLTILAKKDDLTKLARVMFAESTTIGVRYYETKRKKLNREVRHVETGYGRVRVKVLSGPGGIKKVVPEYEDCKKIARRSSIPLERLRRLTLSRFRGPAKLSEGN